MSGSLKDHWTGNGILVTRIKVPDRKSLTRPNGWGTKRVFDLMKDFGTSKSTKIDSIFDSLLVP
ncbi:MAG: hypothetical protein ABW095_00390, partial [Candidatus Thiodiazotropha sp.]